MKNIFIIIFGLILIFGFQCKKSDPIKVPVRVTVLMQQSDSIKFLKDSIKSLNAEREYFSDQIKLKSDSVLILKSIIDKGILTEDCFLAKFKIAKIKRYTEICERNPKNKKFYYGWVKRTITE